MRGAKRAILVGAALALAGCAQRTPFLRTCDRIAVGQTTRAEVDRLFPEGPARPGAAETFVAPAGNVYLRLEYTRDAPQGVVTAKHVFSCRERWDWFRRTLTLARSGAITPADPERYRQAVAARQIDPLIDLLAPEAGTLAGVLSETPYLRPEFGRIVRIRDEAKPLVPAPPPGQRHLPEVYVYTRRGRLADFDQSHRGFGRWTLLTPGGDFNSIFFVPALIYPGSHAYDRAFVDKNGFLTFLYHFENRGETVNTLVAVKEGPAGTFHVRYETKAVLVREP